MLNKVTFLGIITKNGYTQRTFASIIGMHKNTFNAKINGRGSFTLEQVNLICRVLGVTDPLEKCAIFLNPTSDNCDAKNPKNENEVSTVC